ncbi:polysaccharide deacetylase family protein [Flavobacterium sp. '19STA2R22 D10 B1']|uniref:polysaccharide deacetylase family protein n=1 Tax=Flavobacterium aerium TaxID=3037261 RepID=UPI00278BB3B5|nr:polysaccharide deacetylase family protein [Flavobacterium sp. '19STA2R22 D10 B1']
MIQINWVKIPYLAKKIFSKYVWDIPTTEKRIYLTFDDGPIPEITEWVLDELQKYNAKATFFCIGDNISKHPNVFNKVIEQGHSIGNHTFNHINGWKNKTAPYVENAMKAHQVIAEHAIQCSLFRPPYGKIKSKQANQLKALGYKIIMWDIVSFDFNKRITPEQCLQNIIKHTRSGSIVVFHDSVKAAANMQYALPKALEYWNKNGYKFVSLS